VSCCEVAHATVSKTCQHVVSKKASIVLRLTRLTVYVSEEERASRLKSFLKRLEQDWIRECEDSFSSEISESGMGGASSMSTFHHFHMGVSKK